jgi:hypothetical protein
VGIKEAIHIKDFIKYLHEETNYKSIRYIKRIPTTLRDALLKSGAFDVEEICEEYKRLLS